MIATVLHTPQQAASWLRAHGTCRLHTDSRQVGAGDGFIAWPGARADGRGFVRDALGRGAVACLVEQADSDLFGLHDLPQVACYAGLKEACGPIAAAYCNHPSRALRVIAVTGTNGKTSTAWWLAAALSRLGAAGLAPCALIGTLGAGVPPSLQATGLTTPDPVLLQQSLRGFADAGMRCCVIEASSIGIAERRLDGTAIEVAVFTNFTQDHLDYHGSMEAYWQAKRALFDWPGLRTAVVDIDDPRGAELAERVRGRGLPVWTVALAQPARLRALSLHEDAGGLSWQVQEEQTGEAAALSTAQPGRYNAANLMAVVGVLRALGVPLPEAVRACGELPPVPGRMERVEEGAGPLAVVDYAHTPDALQQALRALRPLARARSGALWCVFGCGGNRDSGKRPLMAAAVERAADHVVVTSDNPRDEDPQAIIDAILRGLRDPGAVRVEPDRERAVTQTLVRDAGCDDVVLIAGKGHEMYGA